MLVGVVESQDSLLLHVKHNVNHNLIHFSISYFNNNKLMCNVFELRQNSEINETCG